MVNKSTFSWEAQIAALDKKWMQRYNELKEYMQGHKDVSGLLRVNPKLAQWCDRQTYYKKNNIKSLTPKRIKLLNELNFSWGRLYEIKHEEGWMKHYNELKEYMQQHKDIRELRSINQSLVNWCYTQYKQNNIGVLNDKWLRLLNKLHFPWAYFAKSRVEEKWMQHYNELKEYMRQHEDLSGLIHIRPKLTNWCNMQKIAKKNNAKRLTEKRIKLLNEINFPWDNPRIKEQYEERWMKKYDELKEFVRLHKRFPALRDDKKYNYLYIWVNKNKKNYHAKSRAITPKRIKLLNDLKIDWE